MLRLFRKIRKKLIVNSMFRKYLLYAVGEVIILILGIVIALQVNNWNENRQNRIKEISILNSMMKELKMDLEDIDQNIIIHEVGINAAQTIINYLENDLDYNDSLEIHFMDTSIYTMFIYQEGSYVTLESLGVGLISNDSLRNQIIECYALYGVIVRMEKTMIDRQAHAENNIFNSRFDQLYFLESAESAATAFGRMVPLDYEALKTDDEYKYFVRTYRNANKQYLTFFFKPVKTKVMELITSIEEEIVVLEKD